MEECGASLKEYAIEGSSLSALGIPVFYLFTSSHDANSIFHKSFCHGLTIHSKAPEINDHGCITLNHEPK